MGRSLAPLQAMGLRSARVPEQDENHALKPWAMIHSRFAAKPSTAIP